MDGLSTESLAWLALVICYKSVCQFVTLLTGCGRRGGLMVSAFISGSSGPGSSPGRGHCVVFLGKTLNSHSASLHPGVQMGTGELNAGGNPVMASIPSRGE